MLEHMLTNALSWVREAGAVARGYIGVAVRRRKADRSWVTQADVEIERLLVERIRYTYPEHGVLAEESGSYQAGAEHLWAVDPIDGTRSFVAGLPLWSISVGLLHRGVPVLGVVLLPQLGDCYTAVQGGGAQLNGARIRVREPLPFDSEDWMAVPSNVHRRYAIGFPGKIQALGSIATELCYVARGSAIGAIVNRARLWDLAAGLAILAEAGGSTRLLSGEPLQLHSLLDGSAIHAPLLAAHPEMLESLLSYVRLS